MHGSVGALLLLVIQSSANHNDNLMILQFFKIESFRGTFVNFNDRNRGSIFYFAPQIGETPF